MMASQSEIIRHQPPAVTTHCPANTFRMEDTFPPLFHYTPTPLPASHHPTNKRKATPHTCGQLHMCTCPNPGCAFLPT